MPKKNAVKIEIVNEQEQLEIDESLIQKIILKMYADEGITGGKMEVAIVDDPTIHDLNVRYLGHDYPTDVLAFEMDSKDHYLEGNVIVSADTACTRAEEFNMKPEKELLLYIIHGTLHLLGYDDHTEEDAPAMRAKEKEYLPE